MSGLFSDLKQAGNALNAHSSQASIAGSNIMNLNNPKHAKQYAIIEDLGEDSNGSPQGISLSSILNARNKVLDSQILNEEMYNSGLKAQKMFSTNVEISLGNKFDRTQDTSSISSASHTASGGNLGQAIDDFFASVNALSASPTESSIKTIVVEKANTVTDKFNAISNRLASVSTTITSQINSDINTANGLITKLANLNSRISQVEIGNPGSALGLRDEFQGTLESLSKYTNFNVVLGSSQSGDTSIVVQDVSGNDITLVNGSSVSSTLTYNGTNFVASGLSNATLNIKGGSLNGAQSVLTGTLAQTQSNINNLAHELVNAVNAAYNPTNALNSNFFNSANTTAANIALDSSLTASSLKTTNTAFPGGNELTLALASLQSKNFSTGSGDVFTGTFDSYFNNTTTNLANQIANININFSSSESTLQSFKSQRDNSIGVSLDEEVSNLMKFQKAYQATAYYMNVLSKLLDTLTSLAN